MVLFGFLSTTTIIIVLVIALVVFGPQKLPEIGRQIGQAMRELRKMSGDVQKALDIEGHNSYDYYNHSSYDSSSYSYTPPMTDTSAPLDQYGLDDAHPTPQLEAKAPEPAPVVAVGEVKAADPAAVAHEATVEAEAVAEVAPSESVTEPAESDEVKPVAAPAAPTA